MGLILFPDGSGEDGPDVSWSYGGFADLRRWLAHLEGFELGAMRGYGGERGWDEVTSTLVPLLDHPDDSGELTAAECAAVLPRLEEVFALGPAASDHPHSAAHVDRLGELLPLLRTCVEQGVDLVFA